MGKYLNDKELDSVLENYFEEGVEHIKSKYKNLIKSIIDKSQIKTNTPIIKSSINYDNETVDRFINNLKKEFKKITYSDVYLKQGKYTDSYCQSFIAIKDNVVISFMVSYYDTNINLPALGYPGEIDISNYFVDEKILTV